MSNWILTGLEKLVASQRIDWGRPLMSPKKSLAVRVY
jgi:hypothetical protein